MNSVVNLNAPPIAVFTCFHITALTSPLLGYGTGPNLDDDELPPSYGYVDMGGPVALMSGTAGPALATSFTTASTYGPLPLTVEFDASASTSSTGTIVEDRYEFGDGAGISTNLPIITHTYDTVGVRTVTLEIVNSEGLTAQTQRLVNVSDAPISPTSVLSASPRAGAIPLVVEFNATMSFSPLEEIVEYRFQFGDGTEEVSTSPVASHTYTSLGIYFASVTTVTMSGRTSTSALVPISLFGLNQLPVASFSCTKTGNSVTCDASGSYDLDGEIVDFVWEVSALNLTATGSLLTFEVAEDQTVFVRLSVTDNSGATSMKEKQIGGNLPPLAILNCRIELPNRASCDPALSYDP
ncbi:MAG: PKD domain-containing protein, partial [Bdellovibrio sp.]|nr:PKD domain-containing protein [Bdellovibrio sp.]